MTRHNPNPPTSARHRTDVVSLIFGLLFLAVAGWWAASYYLDWVIAWNLPDVGWLLAAGLIILGLIGIMASLRRTRTDAEPAPAAVSPVVTTEPGPEAVPGEPGLVRPEDPTAELDRPDPTAELDRPDPTAELDRPDPTADLDRPGAADPGGHRPA